MVNLFPAFMEKPLALLCNKVAPGSHIDPRLKGYFIIQNNNNNNTTTTNNNNNISNSSRKYTAEIHIGDNNKILNEKNKSD